MQKIGIIIPTYNEGREVIRLITKINKKITINKILIIDDSFDSKIKNIHLSFNNVIYINRKKKTRQGFGCNIWSKNFKKAR